MPVHPWKGEHAHISEAESLIVEAVVVGKTNSEVGGLLGIKPGTVKNRLSYIFAKVAVRNRQELSLWALMHWQCCAGNGRADPSWEPRYR